MKVLSKGVACMFQCCLGEQVEDDLKEAAKPVKGVLICQ